MQHHKLVPMIGIGILLQQMALPQDQLTPALTKDLTKQCAASPGYQSCVSALRYHGLGKDDKAMEVILSVAPDAAKEHYKIAQKMPNDGFWNLVATAGAAGVVAPAAALPDCNAALPPLLAAHFALSPKALSDAADDSAKNRFLALSDLLAVPNGTPSKKWIDDAQVYRLCFSNPDHLFAAVKNALGR
jgi:hypothetical protein